MANNWMRGLLSTTVKIVQGAERLSFQQLGLQCCHFSGYPEPQTATANIGCKHIEHPTLQDVSKMPGPRVLPLIGTEYLYSKLGPYSVDTLHTDKMEMREKYGSIYKEKLGGHWLVNIHNIKDIEVVMRNEGQYPMRSQNQGMIYYRRSCPQHFKGVGLLDSQGEEWHTMRSLVNPVILKYGTMKTLVPRVSEVADLWVSYIKRTRTSDHIIPDIMMAVKRFGLDAVSSAFFGYRMGALNATPPQQAEELLNFARMTTEANYQFGSKTKWHLWRYFPTPAWRKLVASECGFRRIFEKELQKHQKRQGTVMAKECFMGQFLEQKQKGFNELDIKTASMDLLAASMETLGAFMTRLLHQLGMDPRVQNNLWREIDPALGDQTQELTWKALDDVPYFKATVREAYRILNITPSFFRVTPTNLNLQGYEIPAYTPVVGNTYVECYREENFSRASEFLPERWLNAKDLSKEQVEHYEKQVGDLDALRQETRAKKFLVQPFSFGARSCVGRRIAEANIYVILAKILLNFKIESHGELELNCIPFICPTHPKALVLKDR